MLGPGLELGGSSKLELCETVNLSSDLRLGVGDDVMGMNTECGTVVVASFLAGSCDGPGVAEGTMILVVAMPEGPGVGPLPC